MANRKSRNPGVPDIPLGLGMKLMQDPLAADTFGQMTNAQKTAMIQFIQGGATGDDAKNRIADAVSKLKDVCTAF